jgi:hypothetical protein
VTDNPRIGKQAFDLRRAEGAKRLDVEAGEGTAEVLALSQDREPGQTRLEALEAELLEDVAVVRRRSAPFLVVVGPVERVVAVPQAAHQAVRPGDQPIFARFPAHDATLPRGWCAGKGSLRAYELGPIGQLPSNRRPLLSSTSTAMAPGPSGTNEKLIAGSSEIEMSLSTSSTGAPA